VTIRRRGKVAQLAGPFGEGRQHRIAMRYGFISRHLNGAVQILRRLDGLLLHAKILSRDIIPSVIVGLCPISIVAFPFSKTLPVPAASLLRALAVLHREISERSDAYY
jgi:hypothetical protein